MQKGFDKEETFIDRKRAYRSELDKPIGPSMMITVLPSIIICLFVILAAPYMKQIVNKFILKPDSQVVRSVELAVEEETLAKVGPPPSADAVILEITKRRLAEQGFDLAAKPVFEAPKSIPKKPEVKLNLKPLPLMIGNPEIQLDTSALGKVSPSSSQ